jgi:penicillin-binding protein 1C
MTRAVRSPGSTLKPLIYGLGFEAGLMHPETLVADRPTDFAGYAPRNIDRGFQGDVTVRTALQLSLNVPAVVALEAVGPAVLLARLRAAGVALALPPGAPPGLALALGGAGTTLADLVTLYAAIARGGEAVALRWQAGDAPAAPGARVLSAAAAWQVADGLAGAAPPAGAAPAVPLAWKTGTAWGHRDAWAIGFDGRHTVGVWVGRADGGAVPGLMGVHAAAPLLFRAFDRLGPRTPLPPRPATLPDLRHADLPPGLRRLGTSAAATGPRLAYPPDGARVALGLGSGPSVLALKVAQGRPPFTWLLDGRPLPVDPFDRHVTWPVAEPGHALITVIDAAGAADRVSVVLE